MFGKYCRATNCWLCQNLAQVWSFGKQVVPQLSWCCGIPVHLHWTALTRCRTFQPCPFSHHSSPSVQVNVKFSCLRILKKQIYVDRLTLDVTSTTSQLQHGPQGKLPPIYCLAHMIIWGLVGRGWSWTIVGYLNTKHQGFSLVWLCSYRRLTWETLCYLGMTFLCGHA